MKNSLNFSEFGLLWKFILFAVFLHKSHFLEKSGSWDMSQNALCQSTSCIIRIYLVEVILQFQNLPQQLHRLIFAEVGWILSLDPRHLPRQPQQVNVKYFPSKIF